MPEVERGGEPRGGDAKHGRVPESGGMGVAADYLEGMAEGNPKTRVIKGIIEGWPVRSSSLL